MSIAKTIADAIVSLINAQPRSPRPDEIEAVVSKHVPAQADPTTKTLTYAEFEALIKARGKPFCLSRREAPSMDVVVLWSDPIAVFFNRSMTRRANGMLDPPHRIYVVSYDEEMDAYMMHVAESCAIDGLMPGRMRPLWDARNQIMRP